MANAKSLCKLIFFCSRRGFVELLSQQFFLPSHYFNKIGYAADHKLILIWEPDSVTKKIAKYL